jgi:hypothetical protein
VKIWRITVQSQPRGKKSSQDPIPCACHSSSAGGVNKSISVQGSLGINQDPISKITKAKRAKCMTQVVEPCSGSARPCVPMFKPQYHQLKKKRLKSGNIKGLKMGILS